jgi:hypothetical protein
MACLPQKAINFSNDLFTDDIRHGKFRFRQTPARLAPHLQPPVAHGIQDGHHRSGSNLPHSQRMRGALLPAPLDHNNRALSNHFQIFADAFDQRRQTQQNSLVRTKVIAYTVARLPGYRADDLSNARARQDSYLAFEIHFLTLLLIMVLSVLDNAFRAVASSIPVAR